MANLESSPEFTFAGEEDKAGLPESLSYPQLGYPQIVEVAG